jgi:hypothetical protein
MTQEEFSDKVDKYMAEEMKKPHVRAMMEKLNLPGRREVDSSKGSKNLSKVPPKK